MEELLKRFYNAGVAGENFEELYSNIGPGTKAAQEIRYIQLVSSSFQDRLRELTVIHFGQPYTVTDRTCDNPLGICVVDLDEQPLKCAHCNNSF